MFTRSKSRSSTTDISIQTKMATDKKSAQATEEPDGTTINVDQLKMVMHDILKSEVSNRLDELTTKFDLLQESLQHAASKAEEAHSIANDAKTISLDNQANITKLKMFSANASSDIEELTTKADQMSDKLSELEETVESPWSHKVTNNGRT